MLLLVPAHLGSPGQKYHGLMCMCVCYSLLPQQFHIVRVVFILVYFSTFAGICYFIQLYIIYFAFSALLFGLQEEHPTCEN